MEKECGFTQMLHVFVLQIVCLEENIQGHKTAITTSACVIHMSVLVSTKSQYFPRENVMILFHKCIWRQRLKCDKITKQHLSSEVTRKASADQSHDCCRRHLEEAVPGSTCLFPFYSILLLVSLLQSELVFGQRFRSIMRCRKVGACSVAIDCNLFLALILSHQSPITSDVTASSYVRFDHVTLRRRLKWFSFWNGCNKL